MWIRRQFGQIPVGTDFEWEVRHDDPEGKGIPTFSYRKVHPVDHLRTDTPGPFNAMPIKEAGGSILEEVTPRFFHDHQTVTAWIV